MKAAGTEAGKNLTESVRDQARFRPLPWQGTVVLSETLPACFPLLPVHNMERLRGEGVALLPPRWEKAADSQRSGDRRKASADAFCRVGDFL
jgi:hypothetical protein